MTFQHPCRCQTKRIPDTTKHVKIKLNKKTFLTQKNKKTFNNLDHSTCPGTYFQSHVNHHRNTLRKTTKNVSPPKQNSTITRCIKKRYNNEMHPKRKNKCQDVFILLNLHRPNLQAETKSTHTHPTQQKKFRHPNSRSPCQSELYQT